MQTLQEYKCPCCGGAIAFDSTLQKMKCPYCDTEFDVQTLADYDAGLQDAQDDMEWETAAGSEWQEGAACAPMCANPAAARSSGMKTQRRLPARSAATLW